MGFSTFRKIVFSIICYGMLYSCANSPQSEGDKLIESAKKTMSQATDYMRSISVEGGYLWRYSTDFTVFGGEHEATATQVWIQYPGTPAMGTTFLRAFDVTKDPKYFDAARETAMALVKGQLQSGGWDYRIEFDPAFRNKYFYHLEEGKYPDMDNAERFNTSTYDDDNTQEALRYLISFLQVAENHPSPDDQQIRDALDYGLSKLLEAQYPNGAWPQRWNGEVHDPVKYPVLQASLYSDYPLEQPDGSYYSHYTFNDNAHGDIVNTLILAWKFTGNEAYKNCALHGADYLLLSQLPEPQPAWAQQYDANMHPAWARAFEPPCISSAESVEVIKMLIDMYLEFGDEKYMEPIPRALAWFEKSKLEDGKWARMYELNTNKPIYGDRDRKIHYTLEELSDERRYGYRWQGEYGITPVMAYYDEVKSAGREKYLEEHPIDYYPKQEFLRNPENLDSEVAKIIETLDSQNRWISKIPPRRFDVEGKDWVTSLLYIRNMNILCDYITK